ncbi:hypothetical protein M231_07160 [Tremella mesenterica]|uniref:Aminoglycoside phosphotransferase domain-containing protein n=1 Tax=Tremella mesenterica TaxID=5217 RepID=A0A4Q1BEJ6_TREME|nr:hypothetical protein M231_07160 [Tremella mesenterica]
MSPLIRLTTATRVFPYLDSNESSPEALGWADLASDASRHRPGHIATITVPKDWIEAITYLGVFNSHLPINFDDGVEWLVRFRMDYPGAPSQDIREAIVASEVETMQALKNVGVKVPGAWKGSPVPRAGNNDYPLHYFFIEKMKGRTWTGVPVPLTEGRVSKEEIQIVIDEYAQLQINLSKATFHSGIGSLLPKDHPLSLPSQSTSSNDLLSTGPLLTFSGPEAPFLFGPFKTNRDRYLAEIDLILKLTRAGYLFCYGPLDQYLKHLHARSVVEQCEELGREELDFFIKHPDTHGKQLLMIDGHIEAVLDWEWAYVTTKAEAFASPRFCWEPEMPGCELEKLSLEDELLIQAYERHERPDLADCVRKGHLYPLLNRMIGEGHDHLLANLLTNLALGVDLKDLPATREDWFTDALERFKDDPYLQDMIELDKVYREREEEWSEIANRRYLERLAQRERDAALKEGGSAE